MLIGLRKNPKGKLFASHDMETNGTIIYDFHSQECRLAHKTIIFVLEEFDLFAQGSNHEHWSSFAPLPFEVVISARQKMREDA
ncbi:hypothetical protein L1887_11237 [Cichorium endivia]|nr:hypothetical protein L1887_11237 [Cichorium endivia]